jgi:hypothetical protein
MSFVRPVLPSLVSRYICPPQRVRPNSGTHAKWQTEL